MTHKKRSYCTHITSLLSLPVATGNAQVHGGLFDGVVDDIMTLQVGVKPSGDADDVEVTIPITVGTIPLISCIPPNVTRKSLHESVTLRRNF